MTRHASVWIVRHSESEYNAEGRWAGWIDTPLTAHGRRDAEQAQTSWQRIPLDTIASSDLQRAAHGADILARNLRIPRGPRMTQLRERHAGTWQGQRLSEIEHDPAYQQWRRDHTRPIPGGESNPAFLHRLEIGIRALLRDQQQTLAVTHDGVLTGLCTTLGLTRPEQMRPLRDAVHITRTPHGRLTGQIVLAKDTA